MKYVTSLLLFIGLIVASSVFGYEQQGFEQYIETSKGISFSCTQQCFILLGNKGSNDSVTVKGIEGQGQMIIGALGQNGQLVPLGQQSITPGESDYVLIINSSQGDIPADAQLGVVFVGNISAVDMQISLGSLSFGDKIIQGWRGLLVNEGLMPYSINLRYGIKLMGTSIVKIGYIIFIVILFSILFGLFYKKQKAKAIFYYGICIVLLLGIRNLFNWIDRTTTGLEQYTFANSDQKVFFDLGDYIVFTDKMRNTLLLDDQFGGEDCAIFSQGQSRPFIAHLDTIYIKPCNPVSEKSKADYLIYYHQTISQEDLGKTKLLEFNGSFVLKNK